MTLYRTLKFIQVQRFSCCGHHYESYPIQGFTALEWMCMRCCWTLYNCKASKTLAVLPVCPRLRLQLSLPRGSAEYCISSLKYPPINWFNISYSRSWPGRINQWKPHLILNLPGQNAAVFLCRCACFLVHHSHVWRRECISRVCVWGCDMQLGKTSHAINGPVNPSAFCECM